MKKKWILSLIAIAVVVLLVGVYLGWFGKDFNLGLLNGKPTVTISYPGNGATVSRLVMISGSASDPDKNDNISVVEVQINDGEWVSADGADPWGYDWSTYSLADGTYTIRVRSYDDKDYSAVKTITVTVDNPTAVDSGAHKFAIFIAAANFPEKNETKLGNGGLYLAEDIAAYLVENCQYPTSNIMVLFDDGWIRSSNGYGSKDKTLQERSHEYDISYGPATKEFVLWSFDYLINLSNTYDDSEVFVWVFNHGVGNQDKKLTGGKLLSSSEVFLWDDTLTDKELGDVLAPLTSDKVTVIVDACYAGGFADRVIYNLRTSLFFRSGIPHDGRVVISGTSKFTSGFASTTRGPIFSLLWFEGLSTGAADGYKPGAFDQGVPRRLKLFQDGSVSVEEAFYYARYMLRTDENLEDFSGMRPQINDRFPHRGVLRSHGELVLGEG